MSTDRLTLSSINRNYALNKSKDNSEPPWFQQMREDVFSKYDALPYEVSPLYSKYSDANKLRPEQVYLSQQRRVYEANSDLKGRIKELENETGLLQIGPTIVESHIPEKFTKMGLLICDLSSAIKDHAELIKESMDRNNLDYAQDKFLSLAASCFESGIFVYVPKNVIIDDNIRIINALPDDGSSSIARNMIFAEQGSKATIVQEIYGSSNTLENVQQSYFELLECHVGANANLEMVTIQAMNEKSCTNFSNRKGYIERDGRLSWYLALLGARLSRYKVDSIMKGAGSSAEDVEIIFGVGDQSFDITSNLIHYGPSSRGRVLSKSVMKDSSKSLFKGMIKIGKEAVGTESFLAGHAVLLDKNAKSDAIPGLEIETNEVRATHAASVAQIDENQIFYLMTRGLGKDAAKREIVQGFLEPLSRKMGPTIRAWVNYLMESKWSGQPLMLKTDEAMEQMLEVEKSRYREVEDIFEKHYKYR
jgi:Fe-S cluster assembly scaffold protein SufB